MAEHHIDHNNATTIREANIEDMAEIQHLSCMLFDFDRQFDLTLDRQWVYSPEGIDYYQTLIEQPEGLAIVACQSSRIVGFLLASIHEVPGDRKLLPNLVELDSMMVLEEYRDQRIGKQLIDCFFSWCQQRKLTRIRVVASAANEKAIGFYRKLGFKDFDLVLERDLG